MLGNIVSFPQGPLQRQTERVLYGSGVLWVMVLGASGTKGKEGWVWGVNCFTFSCSIFSPVNLFCTE